MRIGIIALVGGLLLTTTTIAQDTKPSEPVVPHTGKTFETSIGEFTDLGYNQMGYHEFKRHRDDSVMVYVPAGTYQRWPYASNPSQPNEPVTTEVPGYLIDTREITNKQAAKALNAIQGVTFTDGQADLAGNRLAVNHAWGLTITKDAVSAKAGYENHPVIKTTAYFALAYAKHVGANLPYAYEWEKAAGGPSGLIFPWGNSLPDGSRANLFLSGPKRTMQVSSFKDGRSPYGCFDLAGNVSERVYDYTTPIAVNGEELPIQLRGGSWATVHWANTRTNDQDWIKLGSTSASVGFRTVIRDIKVLNQLGLASEPRLRIAKSVDDAFEEAETRNVPIFLFLGFDTDGGTDRVRTEILMNPKFIEYANEHAVVLIGHHPGDGEDDPSEPEEGPSVLYAGARAEDLRAVYTELCEIIDTRTFPKAIWDFKLSPGVFALNPHQELQEEPEQMILVGEDDFPKDGDGLDTYIQNLKNAQKALGKGQTYRDFKAGKPAPKTIWKPTEEDDE